MNNRFICRLFFALASSLPPITGDAAATIAGYGTSSVPRENLRNEPYEFSLAFGGWPYVYGRKNGEADYLGASASHNPNVLADAGPLPGNYNQPDPIASVLGVLDYIQVPYKYISTSGGYD